MKSSAVYLDRTQVSYLLALAQSARIRTGSPISLELVALLRAEMARRAAADRYAASLQAAPDGGAA